MTAVAELLLLQDKDLALDKALARLSEIETALGESDELIAARELAAEKAGVVSTLRSQQKDLELAADEIRNKAAEIEKKLYSGTVKNPKELQDYDAELRNLKELLKKRDDDVLSVLEQVEAADKERADADAEVSRIETDWLAGQDQLNAEKAEIEPEVARLKAEREAEAGHFDRRLLSLYDILRERRGGTAVARVERGMCQGCRITLPMSVLQRARQSGGAVIQCVSCERILLVT
jgi:uncharacterized protein